ncbi:MAG TPA: hypothetical protein VIO38_00365 [Rariglobus sp.]
MPFLIAAIIIGLIVATCLSRRGRNSRKTRHGTDTPADSSFWMFGGSSDSHPGDSGHSHHAGCDHGGGSDGGGGGDSGGGDGGGGGSD